MFPSGVQRCGGHFVVLCRLPRGRARGVGGACRGHASPGAVEWAGHGFPPPLPPRAVAPGSRGALAPLAACGRGARGRRAFLLQSPTSPSPCPGAKPQVPHARPRTRSWWAEPEADLRDRLNAVAAQPPFRCWPQLLLARPISEARALLPGPVRERAGLGKPGSERSRALCRIFLRLGTEKQKQAASEETWVRAFLKVLRFTTYIQHSFK